MVTRTEVAKSNCFAGKILYVNLTTGRMWTEPTMAYAERFLGGRGINNWLLYKRVKPWVTPLESANVLIIGAGALVGTLAPCASRLSVDGKSPMTGGVGSSSSCGYFAAELKFAGYDHIVIQGRARNPVYLWIDEDRVRIEDAAHLWGKLVSETAGSIKEERGDDRIGVLAIGPAGENLVRGACIIVDQARAAGRCGLGAVMGAKNLKAIAVRGKGGIGVADPDRFMEAVDRAWEKLGRSESARRRREWGTLWAAPVCNEIGLFPWKNFQDDYVEADRLKRISPQVYSEHYQVRRLGYMSCPISCSRIYEVKDGPYKGLICEGIEANDLWNFGGRLAIDYPPAILKAHHLCNEYGLDQDNAAGSIAWAFECYEKGLLTEEDTDGLSLEWGNYEVVIELLKKMAYREGFGDLLAEGSKRASEIIGRGSEAFAIHVKGQDSMEPMRACKGWALGCAVSTRGGSHTRGANLAELYSGLPKEVSERIWGIPAVPDRHSYKDKAKLVVYYERLQAIVDSLGICLLCSNWGGPDQLDPEDLAELYSAAVGREITGDDLMLVGERIHNIEKAFNVLHAGFTRQDDYPPLRFMEEPIRSGPARGEILDRAQFDQMLDEYYEIHGWDKETGWQRKAQLERLGLSEIAADLERSGKIL